MIRNAIISLVKEFEGKKFTELRDFLLAKDSSFEQVFLLPFPPERVT